MISDLLGRIARRPVPLTGLLLLAAVPIFIVPMSPVSTPWHANGAELSVVSEAAIFGVVAVATGMFVNLTGLASVAQAGLWGLGAYAAAVSLNQLNVNFWLSFVFAAAVPLIIGWPMAVVSLRTRGYAFLIVTLAFSEFIVLVLENAAGLTGGFNGIAYNNNPSPIGPLHFDTTTQLYYLDLFVLLVAVAAYWFVRRSRFGRRVTAIRDNLDLGRSLSLNSNLHQAVMFELSAAITGLAGPLILVQQRVITPDLFDTTGFLSVYLMIMLGGVTTIVGPVVGAWIVELLPQWIGFFTAISPNVQQLIYGILLVFFVLVARQGVIGQISLTYAYLVRRVRSRSRETSLAVKGQAVDARPEDLKTVPTDQSGRIPGVSEPRELSPNVVLATTGLCHHFGANRVLDDLDFDLRDGEIRGLIGPNGSGKTTMLNCVSGLMRPAGGSIKFRGQDIAGRRFDKVSSLGLVRTFQQPEVFASFTPRQTCEMVLSSVGALGGGRAVNHQLPDDASYYLDLCALGDVADQSSVSLPYGQTRLLGVAAALARRPFVLMLDEPAAGLGQQDRARLGEVILQAREAGVSVVIVDHDMSFLLPLCDRLTVFDYGVKLAEGDPLQVCRDPRVITAYLGSGFAERHAASAGPDASP